MRITDDGTVVGINLAVTIEVLPLVVTYVVLCCRFNLCSVRKSTASKVDHVSNTVRQSAVVKYFALALVDTVVYITVEHTYWLTNGRDGHL